MKFITAWLGLRKKKKNKVCYRGHLQIPENLYSYLGRSAQCKLCMLEISAKRKERKNNGMVD